MTDDERQRGVPGATVAVIQRDLAFFGVLKAHCPKKGSSEQRNTAHHDSVAAVGFVLTRQSCLY